MGNGDGTFQAPIFFPAGTNPSSIVAGDWTGSGVIDLAVADSGSDDVTVLMGNGRGGFRASPRLPRPDRAIRCRSWRVTSRARGYSSLAVVDQSTNGVSILLNNGRGEFVAQPPISLGDDLSRRVSDALVAGDFKATESLTWRSC